MIPKPRRVRDRAAIEAARKPWCEVCGKAGPVHVHHIDSRGAGHGDVADNLVSACPWCHARIHAGQIPRERLREIVRRREDAN